MAGGALPRGRNLALAQLIPTSQCDLGPTLPIPNLSLPISTRREVGWSLGPYSQRAAPPWCLPRYHRVCLGPELPPPSDWDSQRANLGRVIIESMLPPVAGMRLCREGAQMFADGVSKTPFAKSLRVSPALHPVYIA